MDKQVSRGFGIVRRIHDAIIERIDPFGNARHAKAKVLAVFGDAVVSGIGLVDQVPVSKLSEMRGQLCTVAIRCEVIEPKGAVGEG